MDRNDGKPWSLTDVRDLRDILRAGGRNYSVEQAAEFLCRSGTVEEVRKKAEELGLVTPK